MLLFPLGEEEREKAPPACSLASQLVFAAAVHMATLSQRFCRHSMVNYSQNQKPVGLEENCYASICPCSGGIVLTAQL